MVIYLFYTIGDLTYQSPLAVVPCGRTDRCIDITNLIVALSNFANAPKKKKKGTSRYYFTLYQAVNYLACLPTYKCLLFI